MNNNPLTELKDIHLPTDPSFWPPAIGWWLVLIMTFILTILTLVSIWIWKRRAAKRAALKELSRIKLIFYRNKNHHLLAKEISMLLRRAAITAFPEKSAASLTNDTWIEFLNAKSDAILFSKDIKHIIAEAPYRSDCQPFDDSLLIAQTEKWLRSNL